MTEAVEVYYLSWCGFCRATTRMLESEKIPFTLLDVTSDQAAIAEVKQRTGHRTMPIILLRGELIGGYDELTSYIGQYGAATLRA
jgi:glutaredoxin